MWSSTEPRARRRLAAALAGGVLLGTAALAGPNPLAGPAAAQSAPGVPTPSARGTPGADRHRRARGPGRVGVGGSEPARPHRVHGPGDQLPPAAPGSHHRGAAGGLRPGRPADRGGRRRVRRQRPAGPAGAGPGRRGRRPRRRPAGRTARLVGRAAAPVDTPAAATSGTPLGGLGLLWAVLLPPLLGALVLATRRLRRSRRHLDAPAVRPTPRPTPPPTPPPTPTRLPSSA